MKDGFDLKQNLSLLPDSSGVYIMYDKEDSVIYVGKAKVLKNRVRQYFHTPQKHSAKVRAMVKNIHYFKYIITDSEIEALVLECNLIKKYRPKYNILLKDDKQYPYIKVTINETYPRLIMTRTLKKDGGKYFGPYKGMSTVKNVIDLAVKIFKTPTCSRNFSEDAAKQRPCLNYHIKTCFAPCTGKISEEEYRQVFYQICDFLSGDHKKLIEEMTNQMKEASENLEFEKAADLRDKIMAVNKLDEKQKIINSDNMTDMDVIAVEKYENNAFCEIFFIRKGKVSGAENIRLTGAGDETKGQILANFITQFYVNSDIIPKEVITQTQIEDRALIEDYLSQKRGKKVKVLTPQKGEKKKIADMVLNNAKTAALNYMVTEEKRIQKNAALTQLKKSADLLKDPEYIEAYDISNISGTENVGAMVVFKNGKPAKSRYRRFNIKSFEGADDIRAMKEVLLRRIKHAYDEEKQIEEGTIDIKKAKFLPFPDLILVDGGIGHVNAVLEILEIMSKEDIPVLGMVKDDKHRTKALIGAKGVIEMSPVTPLYKLVASIQDEVHDTAISHHRKKRNKSMLKSELDNIQGVGEKKRIKLLNHFKTIEKIKEADIQELTKAGIDKNTAINIINYFSEN